MCVISEENTTLNSCFLEVLVIPLESAGFGNIERDSSLFFWTYKCTCLPYFLFLKDKTKELEIMSTVHYDTKPLCSE